ncbi:MAG: dihydroxyacetone kinase subunit L [Pseudomonadota bacterium]
MSLGRADLVAALERVAAAMERDFAELNELDGQLGDGDLGVTMTRGMRAVIELKDTLSDDLGMALLACAQAFTKSSGSSYGTLMATGLMAAAKTLKGRTDVAPDELAGLIADARDKMQARGKAELGGKTVLDSLDALAEALAEEPTPAAAKRAVAQALEDFRDKPATVGRARIFAEKSQGMDDPGMLAMERIITATAE